MCVAGLPHRPVPCRVAHEMPAPLRDEVLLSHADVARLGRLELNGELLLWDTRASSRRQLDNFLVCLHAKLGSLPELAGVGPEELWEAIHLYCKSVSMNYALVSVLQFLRCEFCQHCTIQAPLGKDGPTVCYGLTVRNGPLGPTFCPHIQWSCKDNVVGSPSLDQDSDYPEILGTLSRIDTEFPLFRPDCKPSYRLRLKTAIRAPRGLCTLITARRGVSVSPTEPLGSQRITKKGSASI